MENIAPLGDDASADASRAARGALGLVADLASARKDVDPEQLGLGDALQSFFVDSELLNHLRAKPDVAELGAGFDGVMFPVNDGSDVVSAVTVRPGPAGWKVDAVGSANLMRAITAILEDDAEDPRTRSASYFYVSIPVLHLALLGRTGEDGWRMRSIYRAPDLQPEPERWAPAWEILDRAALLLPNND